MAERVPRLVAFTDASRAAVPTLLERFESLAQRAAPDRVLFVVRDYLLPVRERWKLAEQLAKVADENQQWLGVAERADVALGLACRAFHLPQGGLSAADARGYLGPNVWLSRGCHDPDSAVETELDALLLSPIFAPRKGRAPLGVAALARASAAHPEQAWFALGGVGAGNAASCLDVAAAGVAVIGAALEADPEPLLAALGILRG